MAVGVHDQREAILHAQLVEDLRQVLLDGPFGDEQPLADLLVPQPFADQGDDLPLLRRQRPDPGRVRVLLLPGPGGAPSPSETSGPPKNITKVIEGI